MKHLIVNISWQEDYWQGTFTSEDKQQSNHDYVKGGNLPLERWNFALDKFVVDGQKIGFFQMKGKPNKYNNGYGIVFFYSDNYIVGLYGCASVGISGMFEVTDDNHNSLPGNVSAPVELCVRWREIKSLPVDKQRYFNGQQRMSQNNAIYIEDEQARQILSDAMISHTDCPDVQERLRRVMSSVWPKAGQMSSKLLALMNMAERTRNILLYGPPGTGKTYQVQQFANSFPSDDHVKFVTFHQSFSYEDFIEGIRPETNDGQVTYDIKDGIFKRICARAEAAWREDGNQAAKYLLIIDEINRANIAKVLGELITLIEDDKRLGEANELMVTLPYSGKKFGVPPNLTILGTMNTADRSIALLDIALRRRFTFVELMPDPTLLKGVPGLDVNLNALLTRLNKRITALLDQDHQIGHSYFMNVEDVEGLRFAWYRRVVPLLQEYFYNDSERLKAVLGKAFITEKKPETGLFDAPPDSYDADLTRIEVNTYEKDDTGFLNALRQLSGIQDSSTTPNAFAND